MPTIPLAESETERVQDSAAAVPLHPPPAPAGTRTSVSQQWVGGRCCLHWTNIAGRTKGRRAEEGGRRPIALLIRVPKNQLNRVCVFIQPPMSSIVPAAAAGIVTSGKCKILFWNFCFCAFVYGN